MEANIQVVGKRAVITRVCSGEAPLSLETIQCLVGYFYFYFMTGDLTDSTSDKLIL